MGRRSSQGGIALLLGLLACFAGAPALAQEPEPAPSAEPEQPASQRVGIELRVGLVPGDQPPGWTPVELTISNPLATREVALEVAVEIDGATLVECSRPATLPAQGKRKEWFYLPLRAGAGAVRVRIRDATSRALVAERSQNVAVEETGARSRGSAGSMRVLYIGGHAGTQARDAQTLLSPGRASELALRDPSDLPSRTEGFSGVDLVALHDADLSGLTRSQQLALAQWVGRGGSLLLIPGRKVDWFSAPLLQHFLGGAQVRSVKVNRLSETERRFGQLSDEPFSARDPFEVFPLRRTSEQERVVRSLRGGRRARLSDRLRFGRTFELLGRVPYGAGEVFVLAADLSLPPFDRWRGLPQLVRRIHGELERSSFGAERLRYDHRDPYMRPELCRALDSNEDPDKTLVILLVLVYIVCVGPLNFYMLRKRDQPLLLALTVPAISLLFSLMVFISGYVTKGLGTVTWRISVVSANLGSRQAIEETALSIRSSSERRYAVGFEAPLVATQVFRSPSTLGRTTQTLIQDPAVGFRFPTVPLGIWEQAAFEGYASRELSGGLTVEWKGETPRLVNKTQYSFQKVVILGRKDLFFSTGAVAAGKSADGKRAEGIRLPTRSLLPSRCARLLGTEVVERELIGKALESYGRFRGGTVIVVGLLAAPPSKVTIDNDPGNREVCLFVAQGSRKP